MANRKRPSASEMARRLKVDPFRYLCERFNELDDPKNKIPLALELLPYCYPKLMATSALKCSVAEDDQRGAQKTGITIRTAVKSREVRDTAGTTRARAREM